MAIKNPPKGYHSVTPSLTVDGAAEAIDFYRKAFGAEEESRMPGPGGKLMHAEVRIGDSVVMLSDAMPEMGNTPTTASLYIYADDCDAMYKRAVAAGGESTMEPADMFWGDRMAGIKDRWGNRWGISTRIKDMSPEEMKKAGQEWMASQQPPK